MNTNTHYIDENNNVVVIGQTAEVVPPTGNNRVQTATIEAVGNNGNQHQQQLYAETQV